MTLRPRWTIKLKLLLLVAAAVMLAQLVVAGLSVWQETARYAAAKRDVLLSTAEIMATSAAKATAAGDAAQVREAIRAGGRINGINYVGVDTAAGRHLADLGATELLDSDLQIDETTKALPI